MGHLLPHPFTGWGSLLLNVENAVRHLLTLLYRNIPSPLTPKSNKTPPKTERNREIQARYAESVSVPQLAKDFGISEQRIHQILRMTLDQVKLSPIQHKGPSRFMDGPFAFDLRSHTLSRRAKCSFQFP